ncbi:MAG: HDOD domain-containing protein, partial [Herminiimonas sp.]|nr:HDOD domain-containing protein [Herminiimonas sp.]
MDDTFFIVREPLLDPKQKVLGYELTLQKAGSTDIANTDANLDHLAGFVAGRLHSDDDGWLLGDNLVFMQSSPALLGSAALEAMSPQHTVLTLKMADLVDDDTIAAVKSLRAQGFGISLRDANAIAQDKTLVPIASHVEIQFATTDFPTQAKIYGALKQSSIRMVARQIANWQEYDSCASLGLNVFIGGLYREPRNAPQPKGLNPAQAMILQLMDMVRKNADVRQLEAVLKRDAALSYKLLRYINSAGFGLGTEIQSLRHAVAMLGYSPLYRWLSVLLATASANGESQILMQTAIVRGRLAELLGQGLLPKSEAENLFVAGMFSLLDRLLGIPMEEVLDNIQLSEAVSQALLSRGGMYGPALALAEACEFGNGCVSEIAESLFISATQVNEAHM